MKKISSGLTVYNILISVFALAGCVLLLIGIIGDRYSAVPYSMIAFSALHCTCFIYLLSKKSRKCIIFFLFAIIFLMLSYIAAKRM